MNTQAKKKSIGALTSSRDWRIRVYIAVLAVIIVSLLGPFSTYDRFPLLERGLYWGLLIGGAILPGHLIRKTVRRIVSGTELKRDIVAVVCLGLTLGPAIWAANLYLLGFELASWMFFVEHVVIVWLICAVPVLVRQYYRNKLVPSVPEDIVAERPSQAIVPTSLARHMEPALQGNIQRVSADGHQLIIFTEKGETRVRMRFADALEHLAGSEGAQVHRSHWLSFDAIESVAQDGRRYNAILGGGAKVPVSPSRLPELEAAGFKPS